MSRMTAVETAELCATFKRRRADGETESAIVRDLSADYEIQRPAVWKALRRGGVIPPYNPKQPDGQGRPLGGGQLGWTRRRTEQSLATKKREADRGLPAPLEACGWCGTRADVGCAHQRPTGPPPPALRPRDLD